MPAMCWCVDLGQLTCTRAILAGWLLETRAICSSLSHCLAYSGWFHAPDVRAVMSSSKEPEQ